MNAPKTWQEYCDQSNWHEAANIFPLMPDDELQALAHDIKANGLKNPVILLDDKVLDGRNRLLACKLAGVSPDFQSRNPEKLGSPVEWVLSQNLHRRQLTASQRAAVAVEAEKLFAIEAKRRQKTLNNAGGKVATSETGKARDKAAKACGVSPRYVQDAKSLDAKSLAEVKSGKKSLPQAKKAAQSPVIVPKLRLVEANRLRDQIKAKCPNVKADIQPSAYGVASRKSESEAVFDLGLRILTSAEVTALCELLEVLRRKATNAA